MEKDNLYRGNVRYRIFVGDKPHYFEEELSMCLKERENGDYTFTISERLKDLGLPGRGSYKVTIGSADYCLQERIDRFWTHDIVRFRHDKQEKWGEMYIDTSVNKEKGRYTWYILTDKGQRVPFKEAGKVVFCGSTFYGDTIEEARERYYSKQAAEKEKRRRERLVGGQIPEYDIVYIFARGFACEGRGPAGAAYEIVVDGNVIAKGSEPLGETTASNAEYQALAIAMKRLDEMNARRFLVITDVEYIEEVFSKHATAWAENGWVKEDGSKPNNLRPMKKIYSACQERDVSFKTLAKGKVERLERCRKEAERAAALSA